MTPLLYRLGQAGRAPSPGRPWRCGSSFSSCSRFAARTAGPDLNDNLTLPGSDSQKATDLLADEFPSQANGTNPVVLARSRRAHKLTDSKYKKPIDDTVAALQEGPGRPGRHEPAVQPSKDILAKDATDRLHRAQAEGGAPAI